MKFSNKVKKENGIALLITVVIISAVALIAILIANIVITQLKLAGDIVDSVVAIYAADSGVECQLYNIMQDESLNCYTAGSNIRMFNGASVETTVSGASPSYTIESLGSYRSVKRKFQVNIGY